MKNNRGVTLIELLIALAILSIVLGAAYSLIQFGSQTYRLGLEQSELQFETRMAADFIKEQTRNAIEITIIPVANIPTIDEGYGYEYLYLDQNQLMYLSADNGFVPVAKTLKIFYDATLMFDLEEEHSRYFLNASILGTLDTHHHQAEARILLKNVETAVLGSGNAIRYR